MYARGRFCIEHMLQKNRQKIRGVLMSDKEKEEQSKRSAPYQDMGKSILAKDVLIEMFEGVHY